MGNESSGPEWRDYGCPDNHLTDNALRFTARPLLGGEVEWNECSDLTPWLAAPPCEASIEGQAWPIPWPRPEREVM
jgi:hypothetical protein